MSNSNDNNTNGTSQSVKEAKAKSVHFVSLGCPKNLVDTEIMVGNLMGDGYSITPNKDEAETIIVNTCGL